ncbi:hypothetical protein LY76DRAFT_358103 [Colletotrichum caudatum]|nr:hypothetical protein LY76DRAFT_358103 [Colletotrichum caudatum]
MVSRFLFFFPLFFFLSSSLLLFFPFRLLLFISLRCLEYKRHHGTIIAAFYGFTGCTLSPRHCTVSFFFSFFFFPVHVLCVEGSTKAGKRKKERPKNPGTDVDPKMA